MELARPINVMLCIVTCPKGGQLSTNRFGIHGMTYPSTSSQAELSKCPGFAKKEDEEFDKLCVVK
jgi:hypothetical protein